MDDELLADIRIEHLPRRRRTVSLPRLHVTAGMREAALYGSAAVSYIGVGVFFPQVLSFWIFGFAWLLVWVCGLPALARRFRR